MITAVYNDLSTILKDEMIALITFLFLYLTYYFSNEFRFIQNHRKTFHETTDDIEKSVYERRFIGFVLLGIIPFFITLLFFKLPISDYGIGLPRGNYVFLWFLVPFLVIGLGSWFRSSKTINTSYYPEVRKEIWTKKRTILNAVYWSLYLLGYEFGLRGMLFFSTVYAFGLWGAIVINGLIYSLIHIFKGKQEAYGAFFLGILFCLMTYYTGSIWFAVINHILLAVINDIKAVKVSSTMRYDFSKGN